MKICRTILSALWPVLLGWGVPAAAALFCTGCQISESNQATVSRGGVGTEIDRIRISTLTAFETNPDIPDRMLLKAVVELFNRKDVQIQMPCVLRFELYEFQTLSSNWRGRRLILWDDQNLTSIENNEQYWRDYLRAYEFRLPVNFAPQPQQQYVLEATCLFGDERFTDMVKISL